MGRKSAENKNGNGHGEVDKVFRRLPKCVVPVHYNLSFQPEELHPILHGVMSVRVQVLCETSEIVVNGHNISVSNVKFSSEGSKSVQDSKDVFINKEIETIQIAFADPIQPGFGTLSLDFEAEITDNMKGFYRTKVGENKYNFITHFEPVHARRCFPGWDEPSFKATFDIVIIVPKEVVAISNMPIKEETTHDKNESLKVCKYQTTPKMSTYLIAMVIGDFEHAEKTNEQGTLVRVFTPPGKQEQAQYSLDLAAKLLTYYTEYFGIAYPLPKLDLVAIREFPIGGMENYGLITFVDTRLLVDNKETAAINKQFTSLIVAHEVSHLWFGDLVTMKWWTDLYLKEGFAKFIEYLATNHFFPEFDIWSQFVSRVFFSALNTDSLKSSHPIEVPVTNPADIDEIFDNISYQKGASIIKMMYHFIGDAAFRKGMAAYLEKFKFSNAETMDLWDALQTASGKPVGKFMDTFTKQMGFPIITVLDITNTKDGKTLTLKQEKFWADPKLNAPENAAENAKYKWIVPITFCKGSSPKEVCAAELFDGLESPTTKIKVNGVSPDEWIKLNCGTTGFYRVRYSSEVLAQFTPSIKDKTMPPVDRLGLLDDLFAAVKAGLSSTADILNLLDSFNNEDNYSVWFAIRDITESLASLLLRTDLADKFDAYCISLFKPMKNRMGWEAKSGESHTDSLLRALVINRLISHGDKETINEAAKLFDQHLKQGVKISADLRSAVYRSFLGKGDSETLEIMLNLYRKTELSEERSRILQTLGSIKNATMIKKVLDFAISSEVMLNDVDYVFMSMNHFVVGQDLLWQFFKDNIKLFQERYPGGMLICSIVKIVTNNFVGEQYATEVETFFKSNPIHGTERTIQQIVEKITVNSAWLKRDTGAITAFLK